MCDICKDLIACPAKSRRKVPIGKARYPEYVDYYGRKIVVEDPVMTIDKYPGKERCYIRETHIDENSVHYDFRVDNIKFCPFCGEYLFDDKKVVTDTTESRVRSVIREYFSNGGYRDYEVDYDLDD